MNERRVLDAWHVLPRDDSSGYLYSEAEIWEAWRTLRAAVPQGAGIYYSLKANPHSTIVQQLAKWGADMDVCSIGELRTVLDAGISPSRISYLGPGKTDRELLACVEQEIGIVVVESLNELRRLSEIASRVGVEASAILRVNLSSAVGGSRLAMGGRPRQFGIDQEQLLALDPSVVRFPGVRLRGLHSYSGTRNLQATSIVETTRATLEAFEEISQVLGIPLEHVNVGGGFGVPYHANESPLEMDTLRAGLSEGVGKFVARHPESQVHFESGRFLVASGGWFLTRVVDTKVSKGKTYLICSGGTNQFMAASGGGSPVRRNFPATVLTRDAAVREGATVEVDVTGPLCTPNDVLLKNARLPGAEVGDYVAIAMAGAYGASASPTRFLSHAEPFEIFNYDKEPAR